MSVMCSFHCATNKQNILADTISLLLQAVTLGQYTKSIAEGYSKRSEDAQGKVGMQISMNAPSTRTSFNLDILDNNLHILEGKFQSKRVNS